MLVLLTVVSLLLAQSPPVSPGRPWHSPDERQITIGGKQIHALGPPIDPDKIYSLAELIDLAEAHNPERVSLGKAPAPKPLLSESLAVNCFRRWPPLH